MIFVFDFGNARGKWHDPHKHKYGDFLHAIKQLSESEWAIVAGNGKPPRGIIKVNGYPYAVGDAARRYTIPERPKGAARYRREYYGVALAFALSEAYGTSKRRVQLYASHAPGDAHYARNLVTSARGEFFVESNYGELAFNIADVRTFDEPLGGYSNYVFTEKGTERRSNPLTNVTTLVVDVGGYTVDVAAVDPGGEIDQLSLNSTRVGVLELIRNFEHELRANNATLFQDTGDLDIRRVEAGIMTGIYQFGRHQVDCTREATGAINALVNDVVQVINASGGAANFDYILLTGGGAALIYNALVDAFPRIEFLLSEPNIDNMKFSNVFGGAKIARLLTGV